jgi:hypothetical protein
MYTPFFSAYSAVMLGTVLHDTTISDVYYSDNPIEIDGAKAIAAAVCNPLSCVRCARGGAAEYIIVIIVVSSSSLYSLGC